MILIFLLSIGTKADTFSLPFLTDFFGHKAWYKEFFDLSEDKSNLFKFSLENF